MAINKCHCSEALNCNSSLSSLSPTCLPSTFPKTLVSSDLPTYLNPGSRDTKSPILFVYTRLVPELRFLRCKRGGPPRPAHSAPRIQWSTLHAEKRSCQPKMPSCEPSLGLGPGRRPFCFRDMGGFLWMMNLLFPQPALDSLELVGRHPVSGREITCTPLLSASQSSCSLWGAD